jgi:hypothetical protein
MCFNAFGDVNGKPFTIHGQRRAGGNSGRGRRFHHQRVSAAQFLLKQVRRGTGFVGLQRIRADNFGKLIGAVRRRLLHRPHLEQAHTRAAVCRLPGSFDTCEPAADDCNFVHLGGSIAPFFAPLGATYLWMTVWCLGKLRFR